MRSIMPLVVSLTLCRCVAKIFSLKKKKKNKTKEALPLKFDIILLAGGASRRFGSEKLTANFHGKPLYQYALDALSEITDHPIRVVTRNKEISEAARSRGFYPVEAPPPDEGVAASIRAGVKACRPNAFLCFFVCDQPYFTGKNLADFLYAFQKSGKAYGRVCCESRMGNPVIFPPCAHNNLLLLTGDEGGRSLLAGKENFTFFFSVPEETLRDFDTPWK